MKKSPFTLAELIVVIAIIALLFFVGARVLEKVKGIAPRLVCGTNLATLEKALRQYASDYEGLHPPANRWCDLLIDHAGLQAVLFFCKWSGDDQYHSTNHTIDEANLSPNMVFVREYNDIEGRLCYRYLVKRSHYAMNPNCEPNSPGDVVLLFETKGGWNQFGGPEILTTANHSGDGCNVLFNDGRVKWIKAKDTGKLRWKDDQKSK